jgi:hypothetical protein
MFTVSEADAAAIRTAFDQGGELSAAIELRPAVPRHPGQRQGEGVRPVHRELAAVAAAAGETAPGQATGSASGITCPSLSAS